MKKIVYVGFAFQHHKETHAGYNQIRNHINYDYIIDCQIYHDDCCKSSGLNIIQRGWRNKILMKFFGTPVIPWFLLKCIFLGIVKKNLIFHFIYGENLYFPIKKFIRRSNKIVCTLHQPYEWFENNPQFTNRLREVNSIILVGDTELEQFKVLTGKKSVYYIPHGIDTDFYRPDFSKGKEHNLLTVGNWLRNYSFANEVYKALLRIDSELHIYIVANSSNKNMIELHEKIHFLSGITDEQLRDLYQKSSAIFLPLIRYTANNSLLEAGATGCNIIISSDNQDNTYIPTNYISLCTMNVDKAVDVIKRSMEKVYNTKLSEYVERQYSWKIIGEKIYNILMQI